MAGAILPYSPPEIALIFTTLEATCPLSELFRLKKRPTSDKNNGKTVIFEVVLRITVIFYKLNYYYDLQFHKKV